MTQLPCALLMYTICFKKAYSVFRPITIQGKDIINMAALLCMRKGEVHKTMWSILGDRDGFVPIYEQNPEPEAGFIHMNRTS